MPPDRLTPEGQKFFREIEKLKKLQVRVGYQEGEKFYDEDGKKVDLLDVAMFNELGTSRTPSRPFMRDSVDDNADGISSSCKSKLRAIANGSKTAEEVLKEIGVMQVGLVQKSIREGDFAPNAPSTIKRKGSDKPLIDTGQMRQSVHFVITDKKSGGD